jgi:hypothetical protein
MGFVNKTWWSDIDEICIHYLHQIENSNWNYNSQIFKERTGRLENKQSTAIPPTILMGTAYPYVSIRKLGASLWWQIDVNIFYLQEIINNRKIEFRSNLWICEFVDLMNVFSQIEYRISVHLHGIRE